jgi:hypothetical protein
MLPALYRDIHCKNVGRSNGILAPRSAQTMAPMSQRLRRLLLVALPFAQDLLFRAKHLFVAARIAWKGSAPLAHFT